MKQSNSDQVPAGGHTNLPTAAAYPIRGFLDCSTAHLSEATNEWLEWQMNLPSDAREVLGGRMPYGWFIWAPEDITSGDYENVPPDLIAVLTYARERGCDYALFDRDAPTDRLIGLPVFDGDETAPFKKWMVRVDAKAVTTCHTRVAVSAPTASAAKTTAINACVWNKPNWEFVAPTYNDIEGLEVLEAPTLVPACAGEGKPL